MSGIEIVCSFESFSCHYTLLAALILQIAIQCRNIKGFTTTELDVLCDVVL